MVKNKDFNTLFQNIWVYGVCFLLLVLTLYFSYSPERGGFSYSLDDPYIHLALAENIFRGHYGVNSGEFSAPSSSILWPFILAPFAAYSLAPLVINVLLTLANLYLILLVLGDVFKRDGRYSGLLRQIIALLLLLGFNGIGLAFTGMEHVLQTFLSLSILYGLISFQKHGRIPLWFWFVIVLNPLVRYEGMALSGLALGYLLLRGKYKSTVFVGLLTALPLVLFSYFLYEHGLGFLPSSLSAKSDLTSLSQFSNNYLVIIVHNILSPGGLLSLTLMVLTVRAIFQAQPTRDQKALLIILGLAVLAHVFGGRFGWYGRYEIYIELSLAVLLFWVHADWFQKQFTRPLKVTRTILLSFLMFFGVAQYILTSLSTPMAAHNISDQQAQMGRFVRDYWKDKVAVNDLGLVSYKNDKYVLDLYGLGSVQALRLRKVGRPDWMAQMTREKKVRLAMIYDKFFPGAVPASWTPVAELSFVGLKITPAFRIVRFYVTDDGPQKDIRQAIEQFKASVPDNVRVKLL